MKTIFYKPTTCGLSIGVATQKPTLQLGHFVYQPLVLPQRMAAKGYFAMLVAQIALVEYFNLPFRQEQKAVNVFVTHKRLSDVVDLSAHILTFGVRQKQNVLDPKGPGREVDEPPVCWPLPNGMELCLDEEAARLPKGPARHLHTTMGEHLLWNDGQTFTLWLASQGCVLDQLRHSTGANTLAQGERCSA